jgi:hypothetical protein
MQFAAAENNLNEIAFAKLNGPPWDFGDRALNCWALINALSPKYPSLKIAHTDYDSLGFCRFN